MAYFKPRQKKRNLPRAPEGFSIGGASLYDAFIESLWRRNLDEYRRKEIGVGAGIAREPIPYPDKEVWWEDPRSRLDLSREYHKYYSEEDLENERLLKEETDAMERSFLKLLLERSTPRREWLWDAKRKARGDDERRIGGSGVV